VFTCRPRLLSLHKQRPQPLPRRPELHARRQPQRLRPHGEAVPRSFRQQPGARGGDGVLRFGVGSEVGEGIAAVALDRGGARVGGHRLHDAADAAEVAHRLLVCRARAQVLQRRAAVRLHLAPRHGLRLRPGRRRLRFRRSLERHLLSLGGAWRHLRLIFRAARLFLPHVV